MRVDPPPYGLLRVRGQLPDPPGCLTAIDGDDDLIVLAEVTPPSSSPLAARIGDFPQHRPSCSRPILSFSYHRIASHPPQLRRQTHLFFAVAKQRSEIHYSFKGSTSILYNNTSPPVHYNQPRILLTSHKHNLLERYTTTNVQSKFFTM
jgi:hypothetical protein